jgi:hypothetical protein
LIATRRSVVLVERWVRVPSGRVKHANQNGLFGFRRKEAMV